MGSGSSYPDDTQGVPSPRNYAADQADASPPNLGFPNYWLHEDPAGCLYVGNFAQAACFKDLDYANQ